MRKYILYYRVSTKRQGISGLGLEAQQFSAMQYMATVEGTILAEYTEVEKGKLASRPILAEAIRHAKLAGAVLVIAKLDRLARNMAFTSALMDAGVDFICCDNPHATRLTIHILAAFAEDEARRISLRTKEALGAAKRRGVKLGCQNPVIAAKIEGKRGWEKASAAGLAVRANLQRERYGQLMPLVLELKALGKPLREIASALNRQGYTTSRGKSFTPIQVSRILKRQADLCLAK